MAYWPLDPVVVVRLKPVLLEATVTVAPGTTAPLLSVTVPLIVSDSAWPNSNADASSRKPIKAPNLRVTTFISISTLNDSIRNGGGFPHFVAFAKARESPKSGSRIFNALQRYEATGLRLSGATKVSDY